MTDSKTNITNFLYDQGILKIKVKKQNRKYIRDNNSLKNKAKEEVLGEHLHNTATQLMEILQRNLALQKKRTLLLQHGYNPEDIRVCPGKIRVYVVLWYTGTFQG